ncbi:hypothetical protein U1769_11380 [Sphingomonas sp. ZT3P38]|uniref:hypothetical protein n=1 Tax=Parasphingomonas zepuensis TaxID=3096161 RepID=UPI002FC9E126
MFAEYAALFRRGHIVERPRAIVWFERCYLGALAIKLALAIVNWSTANSAATQIGTTIALLLWFGVVNRHSNISRWIIVLFAIIAAIWTCVTVAYGAFSWVSILLMFVAGILNIAAALQLIGADAEPWFEKRAPDNRS